MRTILGIGLMIVGVCMGLYAGIWWAFIGGIVDIIEQVRAPEMSAMSVAIGVAKVFFAGVIGWAAGIIAVFPGWALLDSADNRNRGFRI